MSANYVKSNTRDLGIDNNDNDNDNDNDNNDNNKIKKLIRCPKNRGTRIIRVFGMWAQIRGAKMKGAKIKWARKLKGVRYIHRAHIS